MGLAGFMRAKRRRLERAAAEAGMQEADLDKPLDQWTYEELRAAGKHLQIKGYGKMKKEELLSHVAQALLLAAAAMKGE